MMTTYIERKLSHDFFPKTPFLNNYKICDFFATPLQQKWTLEQGKQAEWNKMSSNGILSYLCGFQ